MPKLPQISGDTCVKALQRSGFRFLRQTGSHIHLRRDDPFAQVSVPNHKTLKRGTLRSIIRGAGLTVEEFLDLL